MGWSRRRAAHHSVPRRQNECRASSDGARILRYRSHRGPAATAWLAGAPRSGGSRSARASRVGRPDGGRGAAGSASRRRSPAARAVSRPCHTCRAARARRAASAGATTNLCTCAMIQADRPSASTQQTIELGGGRREVCVALDPSIKSRAATAEPAPRRHDGRRAATAAVRYRRPYAAVVRNSANSAPSTRASRSSAASSSRDVPVAACRSAVSSSARMAR